MKDAYNEILKVYNTQLATLSVPAWALTAPVNPGVLYVVYAPYMMTADEAKICSGANVRMKITIYSDNLVTGKISQVNAVADEIFSKFLPVPGAKLTLTGMQNWDTELSQDLINSMRIGALAQMQRSIIFNHKITF